MSAKGERAEHETLDSIEARYSIERTLGQGGAGIVYEVRDRESGERLALKKLLRLDDRSVRRLKREFRSLADLHHRNLVELYDLGHTRDAWFIVMELIRGSDILAYLGCESDPFSTARNALPANQNAQPIDLAKLVNAFQQLAQGVRALHRAGMLHRDLKPSNVMVAQDRVVVLDFGLVREMGESAATVTYEDAIAGTPTYMAPEQIQNSALSEATDWYAFGVMLYEALSGALPFEGSIYELLRLKLEHEAPALEELAPNLPAELSALCMALLQREPTRRPGYEEISAVLAALAPAQSVAVATSTEALSQTKAQPSAALVGRSADLEWLEHVERLSSREGRLIAAHVRGPSGAGKSALVEHFLSDLELRAVHARDTVLVLRARCYEREAMPYKALEGLIEGLVAHLSHLDELVVSHFLPSDLPALARAFPALERLPAAKHLLARTPSSIDPVGERALAQQALQELLQRVARQRRIVLWIDDLQWADLDSASILRSWLDANESWSLMLLLTYRNDEVETNACLKLLAPGATPLQAGESVLELQPLCAADVEAMCAQELGQEFPEQPALVARIVAESQGNAFLARQLLTLARARLREGALELRELSMHGLVSQLVGLLNDAERALLHVVAVAGRPLWLPLALDAAGIRRAGRSQLHSLKSLSLIRTLHVHGRQSITAYHDRVREAVVATLSAAERADTHRRLLDALERSEDVEPDWMHTLAVGAGDSQKALRYGLAGAERAVASLAFERAAELYTDCLSRSTDIAQHGELWRKLADSLAACGHGVRAAAAYLDAARHASPQGVVELTRLAAMHSICSGLFEQGETLVQKVLADLNMKVPSTEHGIIAAIGWERLRLAVRGLDFERRAREDRSPDLELRGVTYGLLSIDTQAYDPVRAALFQARALRMGLELGDPLLVGSAFCISAVMRVMSGSRRDRLYGEQLLTRARALADELDEPLLHARVLSARSMYEWLLGRMTECLQLWSEAQHMYRVALHSDASVPGEYYTRLATNATRIGALYQLGRIREGRTELQQALSEARATENRTAILHFSMSRAVDDVFRGEAERARARLDTERAELPRNGFGMLHAVHIVAVLRVGCATEDFAWVDRALVEMWPRFERSVVRRSAMSLAAYGAHTRYLLNRHVRQGLPGDPRAMLRRGLREIAHVEEETGLGNATTTRFEARLAYLAGKRESAAQLYRRHIEACVRGNHGDEIERGRWALGRTIGGDEGEALCREAVVKLAELGIAQPANELRAHFPELAM